MQTFVGMILGALLLVCGVYVYDSHADVERRERPGRAGQSHDRQLGRRGQPTGTS